MYLRINLKVSLKFFLNLYIVNSNQLSLYT